MPTIMQKMYFMVGKMCIPSALHSLPYDYHSQTSSQVFLKNPVIFSTTAFLLMNININMI